MEIGANDAIKILNKNFDYEIVDSRFWKWIKMNAYDAFLYANVTWAWYLENIYLFSPKWLMKIFYNAFNYNFVTGIFDNWSLKNTPYYFNKKRPYLFEWNKTILFMEINSEVELQNKLMEMLQIFKNENIDSTDYIIQRIEKSKKWNWMESFMEYLACEFFKAKWYIVENQIPLAATVWSPDFWWYSLYELNDYEEFSSIFNGWFHIIELAMIRLFKHNPGNNEIIENKNIVWEAKTATTKMAEQLWKYLNTWLYEIWFEIHPSKEQPSLPSYWLITLVDDELKVDLPKERKEYTWDYSKTNYNKRLNNYMKYYLIANLSNDELTNIYRKKTGHIFDNEWFVNFINSQTIEEIIYLINNI